MDEVIVPKFQALIAGETTAQAMYDEIVKQATAVFGEDGCDLT
jgi:multiple sugar transport system substrate-binding protein